MCPPLAGVARSDGGGYFPCPLFLVPSSYMFNEYFYSNANQNQPSQDFNLPAEDFCQTFAENHTDRRHHKTDNTDNHGRKQNGRF